MQNISSKFYTDNIAVSINTIVEACVQDLENVNIVIDGLAALAYKSKISQSDLDTALNTLINEKAEKSTVNTLTTQISTLNGTGTGSIQKQINDAINKFATQVSDDGVINSFKELVDWAQSHGSEIGEIAAAVTNLEHLMGDIGGDGKPATVAAAIEAQITKNNGNYYTKTEADAKYLTAHQSLSNYYTKTQADTAFQPKGSYQTTAGMSSYYTKTQADAAFQPKGNYLTAHQSLTNYYTKTEADGKYQPKGSYLTSHQSLSNYYTKAQADSSFQPAGDYLTLADANAKYQPKGTYLTAHQSLANYYTKTESETKFQPKGNYLTSHQSLTNYYTKTEADGKYQPKGMYLTAHQSLANYVTTNTAQTITGAKQFNQVETKFVAPSLTYTDPWTGTTCAIKITGKVATNDAIRAGSFIKVNGTSAQFLKADGTVDGKPYIAPTLLADATDINALMDNGMFYTPSDGNTATLKNAPFNQTFAMLSHTNYNSGTDIRRSRFAWDGYGNMKVFNDRDTTGNGGVWYDVLTSRLTGIVNGVITINGVSIRPLTSHQSLANYYTKTEADGKYQAKGNYLTAHQSLANYYTKTEADGKYQPKGTYLTAHQSLANYVTLNTTQTISHAKTFSASPGIRFSGKNNNATQAYRSIIESINSSIGVADCDYKWSIFHSSESSWRGLYIWSYDGNGKTFNQVAGFESSPEKRFRVLGKIKGNAFIKEGGTASQFLKADGSVDATAYVNKAGDTMTGPLGVKNTLNINSAEAVNHIALNRAGYNYITATQSGGLIALTSNGKSPSAESGELYISNNVVYPGKDNTVQLGTSGKKWSQFHVTQAHVYGRLLVSKSSGDCRILMGNQDSAGVNKPFVIKSQNGQLEFGVGNSWANADGGTFTQYAVLNNSYLQAPGFKKTGGTSAQFLKADGSVDSTTYVATTSTTYFKEGGHKTMPAAYVDLTDTSIGNANFQNFGSGTYQISRGGYSDMVVHFQGTGSTTALQFRTNYSDNATLFFRKTIDGNRISGPWRTVLSELNGVTLSTAQTITGTKTFNDMTLTGGKQFIINAATSKITRTTGNAIHGGTDAATETDANMRFGSWYGFGWYPTIANGGTVTQGMNAMWLNARSGDLTVAGRFIKKGGTNTQILLANGDTGTLWKAADITNSTTDYGAITPAFARAAINKLGVTALGTSGNYLTWTKNGTANNLTVPYASKAGMIFMPLSSEITKHPGERIASLICGITASTAGLFPRADNANALLSINTHGGNYIHQLGFSSNNQMYHRAFHAKAIDASTAWDQILTSANYTAVLDTRYAQASYSAYATNYGYFIAGSAVSNITTAQFITKLTALGAFSKKQWSCRTDWSYANNDTITDTGCGNIQLAGALIEVFTQSAEVYTVRVTTAPTSSNGSVSNAVFIYRNHGAGYSPNWKRLANTTDTVAVASKLGTSTVGSTSKPIYLDAGTPTALSTTVGSTSKPVYMNAGAITALSATVGSASKPVYMNAGTITAFSSTIGAANRPVYINAGTITAGTYTFGNASGNAPISNGTVNTNLNADMLDGVHASGLLTALTASGNRITATVGGTSKSVDINTVGGLTVYKFTKPDNNGQATACYILISDVTTWYNQGTTGKDGGHSGIIGLVIGERSGNQAGTRIATITALCSYNRNFYKLDTDDMYYCRPCIVKYNSKYYIALFCDEFSSHDFYIIGRGYNVSTIETLKCDPGTHNYSGLNCLYNVINRRKRLTGDLYWGTGDLDMRIQRLADNDLLLSSGANPSGRVIINDYLSVSDGEGIQIRHPKTGLMLQLNVNKLIQDGYLITSTSKL